jgi:hypothetical protein
VVRVRLPGAGRRGPGPPECVVLADGTTSAHVQPHPASDAAMAPANDAIDARYAAEADDRSRGGAPALPEVLNLSSARRDRGAKPFPP